MNIGHTLRHAFFAFVALSAFGAMSVWAEETTPANPPAAATVAGPAPLTAGELARLETFLDQHPGIEARLRENPDVANNPAFQRNHPLFAQFLHRHPEVTAALAARPRWFVHRELVRQSAAPVSAAQIAEFDRLLDQHPRLEKLLVQHPQWLRHPEFLKTNPELHEYMKRHPGMEREGEAKPGRVLRRERLN